MSYPLFNLKNLHQALEQYLQAKLPVPVTVLDDYQLITLDDFKTLRLPAMSVECNGGEPTPEQNGSGQLRMRLRFSFRLLGSSQSGGGADLRALAIHLSQALEAWREPIAGVSPFSFSGWYDATTEADPAEAYTMLVVDAYCDANMGLPLAGTDDAPTVWGVPTVNEDLGDTEPWTSL
jgi:hypothetical protein